MRALSTDRKDIRPTSHEEDLGVADMADELRAVGKFGESDALCEIRSGWPGALEP